MSGANLVILAQICDELSCRQAEFPRILSQSGQNDLEGHGQWPAFSTRTESIAWYMFGANLVILAQICDELSCGQGKVYGQTDGRVDGLTQSTTIPLWPEMPWGNKIISYVINALRLANISTLVWWYFHHQHRKGSKWQHPVHITMIS